MEYLPGFTSRVPFIALALSLQNREISGELNVIPKCLNITGAGKKRIAGSLN